MENGDLNDSQSSVNDPILQKLLNAYCENSNEMNELKKFSKWC
ncbi:hypothetical protein GAPWKB30_1598 [Gilliamella apicola]|nr:hypothetical protein GAPWKB30_1598 [Gilliamella apicola]